MWSQDVYRQVEVGTLVSYSPVSYSPFSGADQSLGFQRSSLSEFYPILGILIATSGTKGLVEEAGSWFWNTWNGWR